ncbi:uncharacterized protein SPAPADRAFT_62170 [Spathaspora passalidarum NRRL Y-27907]|uniref:Uncharacterized protein n=1 Tax=Spathaspora passalidarum (strain NRRL Y-27907 / 11-Y1) TaxID=619300 RepID=G3AQL4_SPAPN|nr:uncharacterized protein SPAPADRAFT_62170 [Spathaspora passalidarum NRRL Y-27907]EGW31561.1 hypothetical protein SPAPADRAFT_62170 [Spathaspora passalidarum NRRL Y-27907]
MSYNFRDRADSFDFPTTTQADFHQQQQMTKVQIFERVYYRGTGQYLISLKRELSVFYDILFTYATLLKKIPPLRDVDSLAITAKIYMESLEKDFNDAITPKNMARWDQRGIDQDIKEVTLLLLDAAVEGLELTNKSINCTHLLFENFSNLSGLAIPEALNKSRAVLHSVTRVRNQLRLVQHWSGTDEELIYLEEASQRLIGEQRVLRDAFLVLEGSLIRYFLRVIAKNFHTDEITVEDCTFIYRRQLLSVVQYQCIVIPFDTEQEHQESKNKYMNTGIILILAFGLLMSFACLRLYDLVTSR